MSSRTQTAMKIDPLAGHAADPSMLVDVLQLVTAYYTEIPEEPYMKTGVRSMKGSEGVKSFVVGSHLETTRFRSNIAFEKVNSPSSTAHALAN